MKKEYDHKKIERKWQNLWEKKKVYQADSKSKKPKYYSLIEFPYPSGAGLHVGHIRSNTAMDIISRKKRMEGYNVLFPIGWDAFGLPTENYAIKTGIHPIKVTKQNTDTFRKQLKSIGFSFDWSREVNTTDPKFYKWTQWIFLQFFKKGLAYKTKTEINWCPNDKIGLANEEVVAGCCERCGTPVEKREKEQWMLAITKYADRLDKDLDTVDYLEKIKIQQRNWIGRSEGAEIEFKISTASNFSPLRPSQNTERDPRGQKIQSSSDFFVKVFTTRPDTIFGVTFIAISAQMAKNWIKEGWKVSSEINSYIEKTLTEEKEDNFEEKEKTGISSGLLAINPANNEKVPIWIVNYVLGNVGTGAIMGVPADDTRDEEFAKKFNLSIVKDYKKAGYENWSQWGKKITQYKLRDWVFSRQRYWGEPIPLINCGKCGWVPVPEKDLPVLLPKVAKYKPTDNGESPLADMKSWVNVKCPKCKGPATRETDTMPNWAGSSWYYLRYTDPKNNKEFASKKNLGYFMKNGVDWYNGGMEHTTLHLLYSRFWHKFLYDLELVPTSEPYAKRTSQGMILAEQGEKMSKSKGNTVNPDDLVKTYGADTLRMYEMFMGPFDQSVSWNTDSMVGPRRFLERIWKIATRMQKNSASFTLLGVPSGTHTAPNFSAFATQKLLHKTIKKVTLDIEAMRFNTAISSMMVLLNEMEKSDVVIEDYKKFLQILHPFAPHITEELWRALGEKKSINFSEWPKWDENLVKDDKVKIAIQINGKLRTEIMINTEETEEDIKKQALSAETVRKFTSGKEIKKIIYVKNRLVNIVI